MLRLLFPVLSSRKGKFSRASSTIPLSPTTKPLRQRFTSLIPRRMAYALSTTKRKFHRILDSISNSSNTSLASKHRRDNASTTTLPASLESPAKKSRVARPQSVYVSTAAQTASETPARRPVTSKVHNGASPGEKNEPKFTPWDRAKYLERLGTFRYVDKWMSKPDKVNEVEWAKRGWRCVGRERVGCASCGKEVVIDLGHSYTPAGEEEKEHADDDEDWKIAAHAQLVERYAGMIVTEHGEGCLWRIRGCDATIQRLPLAHPSTTLDALHKRYESLVAMASELPSNIRRPEGYDIKALSAQLRHILLLNPPNPDEPNSAEINEEALSLALFGWEAEHGHMAGIASCNACFRRLGLWLFRPRSRADSGLGDQEPVMSCLDVETEHREYCPWINAKTQSGDQKSKSGEPAISELSGWEMVEKVVRNVQDERRELMPPPPVPGAKDDDVRSEVGSVISGGLEDRTVRDEKDKERWAKLKKLKKAFSVKRVKSRGKENVVVRPSTAV